MFYLLEENPAQVQSFARSFAIFQWLEQATQAGGMALNVSKAALNIRILFYSSSCPFLFFPVAAWPGNDMHMYGVQHDIINSIQLSQVSAIK